MARKYDWLLPKLICIVDEDQSSAGAISALLRSAAYLPVTFQSTESFLKLERLGTFECLILDVGMPAAGGLELQRRLNSAKSILPIIFITAHDDPLIQRQAMEAGAAAFFRKPVDGGTLLAAIETAIRTRDRSGNRPAMSDAKCIPFP